MASSLSKDQNYLIAQRRSFEEVGKKTRSLIVAGTMGAVLAGNSLGFAVSTVTDKPTSETLEQLVSSNTAFSQSISTQDRFVVGDKNSVGLCNFANKALSENWNYVYGGKGQYMTTEKVNAIINSVSQLSNSPYNSSYISRTLAAATEGERATDCSGLIMDFMWWAGDGSNPLLELCPSIGRYNANAMLDVAVIKGNISSMPEMPGLLVHSNGHVGIYIGNGQVIESRGVDYGVVMTNLADRNFQYWSESPWIDYDLTGIYTVIDRQVYLDHGIDIGEEAWKNKYIYGVVDSTTVDPVIIVDDSVSYNSPYKGSAGIIETNISQGNTIANIVTIEETAPVTNSPYGNTGDPVLDIIPYLPYETGYGYNYQGVFYDQFIRDENGGAILISTRSPGYQIYNSNGTVMVRFVATENIDTESESTSTGAPAQSDITIVNDTGAVDSSITILDSQDNSNSSVTIIEDSSTGGIVLDLDDQNTALEILDSNSDIIAQDMSRSTVTQELDPMPTLAISNIDIIDEPLVKLESRFDDTQDIKLDTEVVSGETMTEPVNLKDLLNTYISFSNNYTQKISGNSFFSNLQDNLVSETISNAAQNFINAASKYKGKPYVYGASGPNAYDCSGFVYRALRDVGVNVSRLSSAGYSQVSAWRDVARDELQPGDLIFFRSDSSASISHIAIYLGNNQILHSAPSQGGVGVGHLNGYYGRNYVKAKRVF